MNKTTKLLLEIGLLLIAGLFAYLWIAGIQRKINFDEEKAKRYEVVVKDLKNIREIQVAYKSKYDEYCGKWDKLIKFAKNDSLLIINKVGDIEDSIAVAQGLVKWDTIMVPVLEKLISEDKIIQPINLDSLKYIPYSGGKEYELGAGEVLTASKVTVKVFEANAKSQYILKGLDKQYIINEQELRNEIHGFGGLKVGSLSEANNNAGNWE